MSSARSKRYLVLAVLLGSASIVAAMACNSFSAAANSDVADASSDSDDVSSPSSDGNAVAPDVNSSNVDATNGCGSPYRDAVIADKPLAYWRMNPTSGVVIPDESLNGHDLTLAGGFTLGAKGALGCDHDPAIHFGGVDGFAFADNATSRALDFGAKESFTIEAWVQRDEIDSGVTYFHVFGDKIGSQPKDGYLFYFNKAENVMAFEYDWPPTDSGPNGVLLAIDPAPTIRYAYYVITFDGQEVDLYADGVLRLTHKDVASMGPRTDSFVIARETGEGTHFFPGFIDEVAIYDRALKPQDVDRHYHAAIDAK